MSSSAVADAVAAGWSLKTADKCCSDYAEADEVIGAVVPENMAVAADAESLVAGG